MKRNLVITLPLALLLVVAWNLWSSRGAKLERARREQGYTAAWASVHQLLEPGMSRSDAEQLLTARKFNLFHTSSGGAPQDDIPLAREDSPVWFCNDQLVQVVVQFTPGSSEPKANSAISLEGQPNDRVSSVTLERKLGVCL